LHRILSAVGGLVLALAVSGADAATLLPDGMYQTVGNLTRVDVGGTVVEYLDWTVTLGMGIQTAVNTYAPAGFSLVNGAQMATLFNAFGMTYGFVDYGVFNLTSAGFVTPSQAAAFTASVGATTADASVGLFGPDASGVSSSYLCISVARCAPTNFIYDTSLVADGNPLAGVALARVAAVPTVPVPAGLSLLLTGVLGFALLRRRGKRA